MAQIVLTPTHLQVHLAKAERFGSLHGNLNIPAALIRGAEVADPDVWKTLGMRLPGTAVPKFIFYGSYWRAGKSGGWTFAIWRSNKSAVTITAATGETNRYKRLLIAVDTPEQAQAIADEINDALTAC